MTNTTEEHIAEAERLYGVRSEAGDPAWEDVHGLVRAYYIWLAKRRGA